MQSECLYLNSFCLLLYKWTSAYVHIKSIQRISWFTPFFHGARALCQGLVYSRHALYPWATTPAPCKFYASQFYMLALLLWLEMFCFLTLSLVSRKSMWQGKQAVDACLSLYTEDFIDAHRSPNFYTSIALIFIQLSQILTFRI